MYEMKQGKIKVWKYLLFCPTNIFLLIHTRNTQQEKHTRILLAFLKKCRPLLICKYIDDVITNRIKISKKIENNFDKMIDSK